MLYGEKVEIIEIMKNAMDFYAEAQERMKEMGLTHDKTILVVAYEDELQKKKIDQKWDILDFPLLGIIANRPLILSGNPGRGKTYPAEKIAEFCFGSDEVCYIRASADMSSDLFIDFSPGDLADGKKLSETMSLKDDLKRIFLIIDEPNRAPEILQNFFLEPLEGDINLKSVKAILGKLTPYGIFHPTVLAINDDPQFYSGVRPIDPALLDRGAIYLKVDHYPFSPKDVSNLIRNTKKPTEFRRSKKSQAHITKMIISLFELGRQIPISIDGELLIQYFYSYNYCAKNQDPYNSGEILGKNDLRLGECIHRDCEYLRNTKVGPFCSKIWNISNRVIEDIKYVAGAFKILSCIKHAYHLLVTKNREGAISYLSHMPPLQITAKDISIIAPFVLNHRIFLKERQSGKNNISLGREFVALAMNQLEAFYSVVASFAAEDLCNVPLSTTDEGKLRNLILDDFHFERLKQSMKLFSIGVKVWNK